MKKQLTLLDMPEFGQPQKSTRRQLEYQLNVYNWYGKLITVKMKAENIHHLVNKFNKIPSNTGCKIKSIFLNGVKLHYEQK